MIDHFLIRSALAKLDAVSHGEQVWPVLVSIRNQLLFLSNYDPKSKTDQIILKDIILGVQAAREVETINMELAELLYEVSAQVRKEVASEGG